MVFLESLSAYLVIGKCKARRLLPSTHPALGLNPESYYWSIMSSLSSVSPAQVGFELQSRIIFIPCEFKVGGWKHPPLNQHSPSFWAGLHYSFWFPRIVFTPQSMEGRIEFCLPSSLQVWRHRATRIWKRSLHWVISLFAGSPHLKQTAVRESLLPTWLCALSPPAGLGSRQSRTGHRDRMAPPFTPTPPHVLLISDSPLCSASPPSPPVSQMPICFIIHTPHSRTGAHEVC